MIERTIIDGKKAYIVRSEEGKNLGTYFYTNKNDRERAYNKAKERLRQVEYFKYKDKEDGK